VLSAGLSYGCYERTLAWHNSETLLTDAIQKYPYRALLSYKWLGNYYMDNGQLDKALENYNVLTMLNAADAKIYDNIGNIYKQQKDFPHALDAFSKSLGKQNNVAKTYIDLAITYSMVGDSANSIRNYALAFRIDPGSEKIYSEAGFNMVQNKQYSAALIVYNNLLLLDVRDPFYYFYRGVAEFGENNMQSASTDWRIAAKSPVQDVGPVAAYNLSVALDSLKSDSAYYFAAMAQTRGYKVDPDYMNKLKLENRKHK
jgi:tetratricopeptide (TPR) repeat protein